jgi:ribonuclease-3
MNSEALETVERLESLIGYVFRNKALLVSAITHTSFTGEDGNELEDFERLEFLGDSVLGLVITEMLFKKYRRKREGELTKFKSAAVSRKALVRVARELWIGGEIRLGPSEEADGGRSKDSILADILESIIGALYLDGGLEPARDFIATFFSSVMDELDGGNGILDFKSHLQEVAVRDFKVKPIYFISGERGPAHGRTFEVKVAVRGRVLGEGNGRTKRDAEQEAARMALKEIET